ncbi:MAG: inositol monophosphatase family protein [Asgard group archaeon]|nr:inositol monophosphatase family protein [Asgard group archaeon]
MHFPSFIEKLDTLLVSTFEAAAEVQLQKKQTDNINITGERSYEIDLVMEQAVLDFLKQEEFPCIFLSEEWGKQLLTDDPKYIVLCDPLDGSNNFSRGIPLVCYGVAIARIREDKEKVFFSDISAAAVRSFYTHEFFYAEANKGAWYNGKKFQTKGTSDLSQAYLSIDYDHLAAAKSSLLNRLLPIMAKCSGTRRFGANLLDMVYVAAGKIDGMLDIRDKLSIIHTPGLFIGQESGATILDPFNDKFNPLLQADEAMNYIVCGEKSLAQEILRLFTPSQ